jgi:hypothetical protein
MSNYLFIGQAPRLYPNFLIPGQGSLIAESGDVWNFEQPPNDGLWLPTDDAPTNPPQRSWPISSYQPDVNQGAEPAPVATDTETAPKAPDLFNDLAHDGQ